MRCGPRDRPFRRLQWQPPGVHGRGAHPSDGPAGEHAGDERHVAERAIGHAHVGDVGHARMAEGLRLSPRSTRSGPPARAPRWLGVDGRFSSSDALDAEPTHGREHPAAADLGRIPALGDQLGRIFLYPYTAMKKSEWTRRMPRAGASCLAAMRLTGLDLNMRQP